MRPDRVAPSLVHKSAVHQLISTMLRICIHFFIKQAASIRFGQGIHARTEQAERTSHAVNVVLLGVGASKEHALDWSLLVGAEGVHARPLVVQRLPDLDNRVPRHLQPLG